MRLSRNTLFFWTSLMALAWGASCSSKKQEAVGGTGGGGFQAADEGGNVFDPNTYCDGIFKGQVCGSQSKRADIKSVNMLLVIDESGSMNKPASSSSTNSKWQEMKTALNTALTSVQDDINFGLKLYPYSAGGLGTTAVEACAVPTGQDEVNVDIAPGASNLQTIINTVEQQTPAGGTPTTKALQQALAYFTAGKGKDVTGQKFVLLATDGGPNCNEDISSCELDSCTVNMDGTCANGPGTTVNCCETAGNKDANLSCLDHDAVVEAITKLAEAGIATYVIGIPGSEAYQATLNDMAVAGAVPNTSSADPSIQYYAVSAGNSLADLTRAFEDITTRLVKSCDIELQSTPVDQSLVQVAMDCDVVPLVTNADSGASGFHVDYSSSPAHVILTGSYCDRVSTVGVKNLDVIEGCVPPP
jgi:hypothetical protein